MKSKNKSKTTFEAKITSDSIAIVFSSFQFASLLAGLVSLSTKVKDFKKKPLFFYSPN